MSTDSLRSDWDVVVVGGGPAGSLSALYAARSGLRTLLVERATFPRWKVCGASLNRAAQAVMEDAGLGEIPARGVPLTGLAISGWGHRARIPVAGSVALRRSVMDAALFQAARDAGAVIAQGTVPDMGILAGGGACRELQLRLDDRVETIQARVLVAAAGLGTLPERGTDRAPTVAEDSRIGVGAAFSPHHPAAIGFGGQAWGPGVIHMVAGDAGYVGLVRTEDGGLNVAGALDPEFVRLHGGPGAAVAEHLALEGAPALPATAEHGWRGTPALTRRPGRIAGPRFFRVGDGAGYVEPFTGEGMAWGMVGARALARWVAQGVERWSPELESAWVDRHARTVENRQRICRQIAWVSRRPRLARAILAVLGPAPWLAAPLSSGTTRPVRTELHALPASRAGRLLLPGINS